LKMAVDGAVDGVGAGPAPKQIVARTIAKRALRGWGMVVGETVAL
jgi:hypothetical protein